MFEIVAVKFGGLQLVVKNKVFIFAFRSNIFQTFSVCFSMGEIIFLRNNRVGRFLEI